MSINCNCIFCGELIQDTQRKTYVETPCYTNDRCSNYHVLFENERKYPKNISTCFIESIRTSSQTTGYWNEDYGIT